MYIRYLKRLRVVVSLLFLIATTLLFLDFRNWFAPAVSSAVLYPQFVPSLMKTLQGIALGATGCMVVLIFTLVAGRVYCSTICPLGTLQDIGGFVSRRTGGRRYAGYRKPYTLFRYFVLALTVLLFLAGINILLNLLDPYSTYGRIINNILRPLGILINNGGAMALENFGIYTLAREHWAAMAPLSVAVAMVMLLTVLGLATTRGRLYCNTICPVGTFLGLVSRFSFLQLRIEQGACIDCKRCEAVCKAECIDLVSKTVDMSRCVGCYNCLAACKSDAMVIARKGSSGPVTGNEQDNPERRAFLLNSGVYILALAGVTEPGSVSDAVKKIIQSKPTTVPVVRTSPVSPPGSMSVDRFTSTCTACHLCVSACPPQILLPSFLEYGASGLLQPRMHFQTGHCNYECTICGDVCPAGAIVPLTVESKKLTQAGVAKFIKENCVVYTDNTACGACSEHCPTKAVNMVPYANKLNRPLVIPDVKAELCIGCGGCEHACPTKPYKAIFVDGNPVHKLAEKPVVKEVDQNVDYQADFPF